MKIARRDSSRDLRLGELFSQRALALARDDRPYWFRTVPQVIVGFLNRPIDPREVPLALLGVVDSTQTYLWREMAKENFSEIASSDLLEEVVQANLGDTYPRNLAKFVVQSDRFLVQIFFAKSLIIGLVNGDSTTIISGGQDDPVIIREPNSADLA